MRTRLLLITIMIAGIAFGRGAAAGSSPAERVPDADWPVLAGKSVSRLDIDIIGPEKNASYWADMAATVIVLTEGDPFSPDLLRQSLNYLNECGRFAEVSADVYQTGESVVLRFRLAVNRVIRDILIDIEGRGGVFKKDVLRVMSVYPGGGWYPRDLARQKAGIEEMLKGRGFPSPAVEITASEDAADYTVLLRVVVGLGPWQVVKSVQISGNRAFPEALLKGRMKTWRASFFYGGFTRFNQRALDRDMESLIKFYREKGFAEVTATYVLNRDGEDNSLSIAVQIDEGPRCEVEFSGNTEFFDRTLKKDLVVFSRGNLNGMGLRKSVKNMKARYGNAGYREVDITVEEEVSQLADETRKRIRLVVDEGPETIIRSLVVRGHVRLSGKIIGRQMLSRPRSWRRAGVYVPQVLEEDIQAIWRLYRKNGFSNARVGKTVVFNDQGTEADIVIEIDEGEPVRVSSVRFEGLRAVSEAKALKALRVKPPALFDDESAQRDKIELAALISEKGHPHVRVESTVVPGGDGRTADIVYHVEEGPAVAMGEVYVTGNLRTRESVVRQEMELAETDPFSLTAMIRSQQNLRSLDIFRSVNVTPVGLKEQDDRVHLFIETFEKKPFFIELGGGYNSEQGGVGKVTAGDHNLLGSNRDGYVSWEISEIGYRGDLGVRSPRFFSTRLESVLNMYTDKTEAFNQNFGVKTDGASFGINRKWGKTLSSGVNVNAESRRQYPLSSGQKIEDGEYETRDAVAVTPGIVYDTRNNGMMPTEGVLGSCDVTVSDGINSNLDDFTRYLGAVRYYRSFFETITIALIGRVGYIEPQNPSNPVSSDQLFFLGGISSVRGFAENMLVFDESDNPVGGRVSLSGSIEARVPVKEALHLIVFYDAGKLDRTYTPVDPETRSSVGIGLGYQTPVGPISLYYGSKLDRKENESDGRFHFSIGYTF